jgi:epsilon-lactone hydrolase
MTDQPTCLTTPELKVLPRSRTHLASVLKSSARAAVLVTLSMLCTAAEKTPPSPKEGAVDIERTGSVRMPETELPFSSFASPEAKATFTRVLQADSAPGFTEGMTAVRKFYDDFNNARLAEMRQRYDVVTTNVTLGGVRVDMVDPASGLAEGNRNRVLISLHGGGFMWGAGSGALVEAVPIAASSRIKVVAVDYRLAPEHKFPAAMEDVAAVYRELLKTYKAENIGIYGCSAGGILTAQTIPWLANNDLPRPGAIATLCATGSELMGDSAYLGSLTMGQHLLQVDRPPLLIADFPYFAGADPHNPNVFPIIDPALLALYPPTLLIAGSRDFSASSLTMMHRQLRKAGVVAELYLFDGLWHAFYVFPNLPESRETYEIIGSFFDEHLGHSALTL